MATYRMLACLALACILAACSPAGAPKAPAPAPDVPGTSASALKTPEEAPGEPSAQPPDLRPVPAVLAEPVTGALKRVPIKSGDTLKDAGVYFLNTANGAEGEGWTHAGAGSLYALSISGDNRFTTAVTEADGYIIDRQTGTVWQWDTRRLQALLANARGFLFAELEPDAGTKQLAPTGRYFWAGPDMKPALVFYLGSAGGWGSAASALLSPDGRRLAVLARHHRRCGKLAAPPPSPGHHHLLSVQWQRRHTLARRQLWPGGQQFQRVPHPRPRWSTPGAPGLCRTDLERRAPARPRQCRSLCHRPNHRHQWRRDPNARRYAERLGHPRQPLPVGRQQQRAAARAASAGEGGRVLRAPAHARYSPHSSPKPAGVPAHDEQPRHVPRTAGRSPQQLSCGDLFAARHPPRPGTTANQ